MKQYHNGQRKGMMYGGNTRKPMMYGGTAKKSPRKKMQMGGNTMSNAMMSTNQTQQQMQQRDQERMGIMMNPTPAQQRMGMADGGKANLKPVPSDNKGLGKLPKSVRNNMGYMMYGGKAKKPK